MPHSIPFIAANAWSSTLQRRSGGSGLQGGENDIQAVLEHRTRWLRRVELGVGPEDEEVDNRVWRLNSVAVLHGHPPPVLPAGKHSSAASSSSLHARFLCCCTGAGPPAIETRVEVRRRLACLATKARSEMGRLRRQRVRDGGGETAAPGEMAQQRRQRVLDGRSKARK